MTYALVGTFWFIVGYVGAVYTWDKLHTAIIGADNKVLDLRAKARAIEASIRAKL